MSPGSPPAARRFARWSALGALAYGMAGQIIYHLLAAAHATAAPWPVVVVVSCMPVAVLGLAAALTHLLRTPHCADIYAIRGGPVRFRRRAKRPSGRRSRPGPAVRQPAAGAVLAVARDRDEVRTAVLAESNGHPTG